MSTATGTLRELHRHVDHLLRTTASAPSSRERDRWLWIVRDTQRLINRLTAAQDQALARAAALESDWAPDGSVVEVDRGLGRVTLDAPDLAAEALGCSLAVGQRRVDQAVALAGREPVWDVDLRRDPSATPTPSGLRGIAAAMRSGVLDGYRASILTEELVDAAAAVREQVVDQIVTVSGDRIAAESPAQLRRRARRVLGRIDPDSVRRRAERARAQCAVKRWSDQPGVDTWLATLPAEDAGVAWAAIQERARELLAEGVCATADLARARALTDLITGRCQVSVGLTVTVPEEAAVTTAVDESGAEFGGTRYSEVTLSGQPGSRVVPTDWLLCHAVTGAAVRRLRAVKAGSDTASTDTDTDASSETGAVSAGYRPSSAVAELVRLRDGHCRFPGCSVNARQCDLDHVVPWPTGPTSADNLMLLCRHHHRVKQQPGWTVVLHSDATVTWTSPTGTQRITDPVDHLGALVLEAPPEMPSPSEQIASPSEAIPSPLEDRLGHAVDAADRACRGRVRLAERQHLQHHMQRHMQRVRIDVVPPARWWPDLEITILGAGPARDPGPPPF